MSIDSTPKVKRFESSLNLARLQSDDDWSDALARVMDSYLIVHEWVDDHEDELHASFDVNQAVQLILNQTNHSAEAQE